MMNKQLLALLEELLSLDENIMYQVLIYHKAKEFKFRVNVQYYDIETKKTIALELPSRLLDKRCIPESQETILNFLKQLKGVEHAEPITTK